MFAGLQFQKGGWMDRGQFASDIASRDEALLSFAVHPSHSKVVLKSFQYYQKRYVMDCERMERPNGKTQKSTRFYSLVQENQSVNG